MNNKIIIIDGNSLLFRAYYATAYSGNIMRTKEGFPTNAIFAFSNMISKLLNDAKDGTAFFVAFDKDSKTFRKEEFQDYKANRAPVPEDLVRQFPVARELLTALNVFQFELHGVEADDLCGTIAKLASKENYNVEIYTSDKDYLQLIDNNISVNLLKTGLSNIQKMTPTTLKETMNMTPDQIPDFKALSGDDSDNLPGVPGVGQKTAVKLLENYHNIDGIISHVGKLKGKLKDNIEAKTEQMEKVKRLATIKTDVELPFTLKDLVYEGYDFSTVNSFAQKYELRSLLSRLPKTLKKAEAQQAEFKGQEVKNLPHTDSKVVSVTLDIDYASYHTDEPQGVAFSFNDETYYLDFQDFLKDEEAKRLLKDPSVAIKTYDGKALLYVMSKYNIEVNNVDDDLLLAYYLIDTSSTNSPEAVYQSFGFDINGNESINLFDLHKAKTTMLMAGDTEKSIIKARSLLTSTQSLNLYLNTEIPLSHVLMKMEREGFPLHKDILMELGKGFQKKKDEDEKQIFDLAGIHFNLNSPKQVADTLFNKMGLKNPRGGSTSVESLTDIQDSSPIIPLILDYRKYAKLLSTYIDGLIPHIQEDNKIHSYFNQAETTTGRLSSSSPNMQNITARDEEGKNIKKAFYYDDPDTYIVSFDYSQIELRLLAAFSHCQKYIDVFNNGHDVHSETAAKIFNTTDVTPEMRRKAKAVNFAIIYGTTIYGLSEQINCSVKEAKDIIDTFYNTYPEIYTYLQNIADNAEKNGYVTTMFGRRRYLRDINDRNYAKREAARRAALNAPIQGSAADLIKTAMIKVDDFLTKEKLQTKMVLQIHDELIFKVPKEEIEIIKEKVADIMVHAVELPVKLEVSFGYGHTWYDAKE